MMVKTVCPPDCPRRHAWCGATCEDFHKHRQERLKHYAQQAEQRKIDEITAKSVRESLHKINRKQKQI